MIQKELRAVIVVELLLPLALTIFGIYHGVLQVLYRSGIIQDTRFLGIDYSQGLSAHSLINPLVVTAFCAFAFVNAVVSQTLDRAVSVAQTRAGLVLMV